MSRSPIHDDDSADEKIQHSTPIFGPRSGPEIATSARDVSSDINDQTPNDALQRAMELRLSILESLESSSKIGEVASILDEVRLLAPPSSSTTDRFESTAFLEDFIILSQRVGVADALNKLLHSAGAQGLKSDLHRLFFHLWSLTCPPADELLQLRDSMRLLGLETLPTPTQVAIAKVLTFLEHPLVGGFIKRQATLEASAAPVHISKTLTKDQIKQLVAPPSVRTLVAEELKAKQLTPSTAYRLSILLSFAGDSETRSRLSELASLVPRRHPHLEAMNMTFRDSLFPSS